MDNKDVYNRENVTIEINEEENDNDHITNFKSINNTDGVNSS